MASLAARMLDRSFRVAMKRQPQSPRDLVAHLRRVAALARLPGALPAGVAVRKTTIANEPAVPPGIPAVCVSTEKPASVVLYLHGGAFVSGRFATYAGFCAQVAKRLNARVFWADYRLAPEMPYPAALDDAFSAYCALAADYPNKPLVIMGDSAGGNLTLATLLRLRDTLAGNEHDPSLRQPACAVALSPGTDMVGDVFSRKANADADAMLTPRMIELATKLYLAGHDPRDPYVSPVYGDFTGLPPLMVTVSESELLRDEAYRLAHRAQLAGVAVRLLTRFDMPHIWPVFYALLPEARRDMEEIAHFVQSRCPAARTTPAQAAQAPRPRLQVAHGLND